MFSPSPQSSQIVLCTNISLLHLLSLQRMAKVKLCPRLSSRQRWIRTAWLPPPQSQQIPLVCTKKARIESNSRQRDTNFFPKGTEGSFQRMPSVGRHVVLKSQSPCAQGPDPVTAKELRFRARGATCPRAPEMRPHLTTRCPGTKPLASPNTLSRCPSTGSTAPGCGAEMSPPQIPARGPKREGF